MPQIPDRWIPYEACGNVIEGTRIICFKVPLKESVQRDNKEIKEIWDIPALLAKIPNLTAVIDLTNTARYYDPKALQAAGVHHRKIAQPGRIIPPQKVVTRFMNTVDEFLKNDCDSLVGVHCTHGLNRTGYMVVRYMRDRLGIPAKEAIKKFEKARGYQIERENFLADLLGQKVPPPDIGKHTKLKPVDNKQSTNYKSPLECDDEQDSTENGYNANKLAMPTGTLRKKRSARPRKRKSNFPKDHPNRATSEKSERDRYTSGFRYEFRYDY